ncbi:MAG: CaiB/BaiF CoA transferase family protein [Anaerolineae bacterium]
MGQLLTGMRVLDLSRLLPGPYCTMLLADQGADVIKVEDPAGGDYARFSEPFVDGTSVIFEMLNRGKRSIALNLKTDAGRDIFLHLAGDADVILEGFRPGTVDRLGIGFEGVRAVNPRIVYCSLSGYGQTGPRRDRAGHDINYIGLAGLLGLNRRAGELPVVPGVQIADLSGGLLAALGIMAALWARDRTGTGHHVDVSMFDGVMSWLVMAAAPLLAGTPRPRSGRQGVPAPGQALLTGGVPCYNVYETADGRYMSLGALEPKFWQNFCEAVDCEDLLGSGYDPGAIDDVRAIFRQHTQAEWTQVFSATDACCEPVLTLEEALSGPQTQARKMVVDNEHPQAGRLRQLGAPVKFSDADAEIGGPAPALGEHTGEILTALGYSVEEIAVLRDQGVIS